MKKFKEISINSRAIIPIQDLGYSEVITKDEVLKIINENKSELLGEKFDFVSGFNELGFSVSIETLDYRGLEEKVLNLKEKFKVYVYPLNEEGETAFENCILEFIGEFK